MTMPHMIGVYELYDCCQELLGWDTARTMELLTSLSTATTAATRELRAVVKVRWPVVWRRCERAKPPRVWKRGCSTGGCAPSTSIRARP